MATPSNFPSGSAYVPLSYDPGLKLFAVQDAVTPQQPGWLTPASIVQAAASAFTLSAASLQALLETLPTSPPASPGLWLDNGVLSISGPNVLPNSALTYGAQPLASGSLLLTWGS